MFQESENVELKQDYSDSIRKDIIAFANSNGGTIYIGVKDDGSVIGIPSPDRMIQRVSNMVRDSIRPDVTMFIHYDTISIDGADVVKISVGKGISKPYYWAEKGLQAAGVFIRQGTSAAPSTEISIRQMIKETDGDTYEDMRSLDQELSFSYVSAVFRRQGLELQPPQMKTLGLLSPDGIYTNLALLLSDQCPHIIKGATFSGTDQTVFQDRREFTGSLLKQVDEAYAYLDMHNDNTATFDGLHRTDHRGYPEAAVREALLNAVIHRDYSLSASTLLTCYTDHMEIISAGGLVSGFSLEDVMMGFSICRNPRLANVFYRLDLIEAYGTGLKKILSAYPGTSPDMLLKATERVFKVTLYRSSSMSGKKADVPETDREKVVAYLAAKGSVTRSEVERLTGLSMSSAARLLKGLVNDGTITAKGNGKNRRYLLSK